MKRWSLDARSEGRFAYSLMEKVKNRKGLARRPQWTDLASHLAWPVSLVPPVSHSRVIVYGHAQWETGLVVP